MLRRVNAQEIEGVKLLGTFCYNPQAVFPIYFVMRVNKVPQQTGYWKKQRPMTGVEAEWDPDNGKYKLYTKYGKEIAGDDIGAFFSFDTAEGEQIEVELGVSFATVENGLLLLRPSLSTRIRDRSSFQRSRASACTCSKFLPSCSLFRLRRAFSILTKETPNSTSICSPSGHRMKKTLRYHLRLFLFHIWYKAYTYRYLDPTPPPHRS